MANSEQKCCSFWSNSSNSFFCCNELQRLWWIVIASDHHKIALTFVPPISGSISVLDPCPGILQSFVSLRRIQSLDTTRANKGLFWLITEVQIRLLILFMYPLSLMDAYPSSFSDDNQHCVSMISHVVQSRYLLSTSIGWWLLAPKKIFATFLTFEKEFTKSKFRNQLHTTFTLTHPLLNYFDIPSSRCCNAPGYN